MDGTKIVESAVRTYLVVEGIGRLRTDRVCEFVYRYGAGVSLTTSGPKKISASYRLDETAPR